MATFYSSIGATDTELLRRFAAVALYGIIRAVPVGRIGGRRSAKGNAVIVYELGCSSGHRFEGWFASSAEFERQRDEKLLACPLCNSDAIERLPHASYVKTGVAQKPESQPKTRVGNQYANVDLDALAKLVDTIVENTEDVGHSFPEEARRIHYHESPQRHIRGTASPREVEALRDEGIDVVAVPIPLHRQGKTH